MNKIREVVTITYQITCPHCACEMELDEDEEDKLAEQGGNIRVITVDCIDCGMPTEYTLDFDG